MLDPALLSGGLLGLERALNLALKYDPGTQHQLQAFDGKHVSVQCLKPPVTVFITFEQGEMRLQGQSEMPPDVEISAQAEDLFRFLLQPKHSLANSGINVSGDMALLRQFQSLMQQLDIDWESALSDVIGDSAGHLLANFLRSNVRWSKSVAQNTINNLPDLLSEEFHVMPHRFELDQFYRQVQTLQSDTDRLNKRVQRMCEKLKSPAADKSKKGANDV